MIKKWSWQDDLEAMVNDTKRVRPRINMHETFQDPAQHMIVVMRQGEERPPHANGRELTQIILAGFGYLEIFDDAGALVEQFEIGARGTFAYKLAPNVWHTRKIISPFMAFIEILPGPYACSLEHPDVRELPAK